MLKLYFPLPQCIQLTALGSQQFKVDARNLCTSAVLLQQDAANIDRVFFLPIKLLHCGEKNTNVDLGIEPKPAWRGGSCSYNLTIELHST